MSKDLNTLSINEDRNEYADVLYELKEGENSGWISRSSPGGKTGEI